MRSKSVVSFVMLLFSLLPPLLLLLLWEERRVRSTSISHFVPMCHHMSRIWVVALMSGSVL